MKTKDIKKRLEYLRSQIRDENISYGEILELQSLAKYIDKEDVELLEVAGVSEFNKFRVYFNRVEEFYIDFEADSEEEARKMFDESDLQDEEETGNSDTIITGVYSKDEMLQDYNIII